VASKELTASVFAKGMADGPNVRKAFGRGVCIVLKIKFIIMYSYQVALPNAFWACGYPIEMRRL
jgi:hypothetical protein